MSPGAPFLWLCSLFLISLCRAQDVIVYMNDSRLVTVPPNLWNNPYVYTFPICGDLRFMNGSGQSVSLSFSGTAITVNLFPYEYGSIALVNLDGKNVTRIDTYNVSGIGSPGYACTPIPWTSDVLPNGKHTITVTELDPNHAISVGLVAMLGFVYKNDSSSTTPSSSANTMGHKPKFGTIVGAAVGGIIALLLIVFGILFFYRRRKRPLPPPTFDLMDEGHVDAPGSEVMTQTGASGLGISAIQDGTVPDTEQRVGTEGAPIAFAHTQPGTPSDFISSTQLTAPQVQPSKQGELAGSSNAERHPSPSPATLSFVQLSSHAGSPLLAFPSVPQTDEQYSQKQLSLLKKLSDSRTDSSIITAVAKSMLFRVSNAPGEAGRDAGDLEMLQRLSDSGADESVIREVAESTFGRPRDVAGAAEVDRSVGPLVHHTEEDAPPGYELIGT